MSQTSVLIVVDAEGALSSGDLGSNVYLIDTNKYAGSGNEGQQELMTACHDGDTLQWRVATVAPDTDAELTGFTGQMVDDGVCNPIVQGLPGRQYWMGLVEARGVTGNQQYSVTLTLDGKAMTFDPFLVIS